MEKFLHTHKKSVSSLRKKLFYSNSYSYPSENILIIFNQLRICKFHVDYRKCSVLHVEITENENPQTTLYCIWHNS